MTRSQVSQAVIQYSSISGARLRTCLLHMPMHMSIHMPMHMPMHMSIHMAMHVPMHMPVHIPIHMSLHMFYTAAARAGFVRAVVDRKDRRQGALLIYSLHIAYLQLTYSLHLHIAYI